MSGPIFPCCPHAPSRLGGLTQRPSALRAALRMPRVLGSTEGLLVDGAYPCGRATSLVECKLGKQAQLLFIDQTPAINLNSSYLT